MRTKPFIVFCILAAGVASINNMYAQLPEGLDTGFRFSLSRSEADPIGVIAKLTTTGDYPCEGYRLKTKVSHQRDTITISILGMIQPSPCYAAYAKATGVAFLGNKVAGKYYLRILYRGTADLYRLVFIEGRNILSPITISFTEQEQIEKFHEEE